MSYRTVKKLLGETSLERKCRFLFGSGLLLLISGSFYINAQLNARLVREQNKAMAQLMVPSVVARKHWEWLEDDDDKKVHLQLLIDDPKLKETEYLRGILYRARLATVEEHEFDSNDTKSTKNETQGAFYPPGDHEQSILARLKNEESEVVEIVADENKYDEYAPVVLRESCRSCHNREADARLKDDDLIGMVKLTFPLKTTQKLLAINKAVLVATAFVTTVLAILAVYAIVRYVIVKPVLHLKDVSDKIARGMLDLRADIRTGDEFEELSHAFNRMLRHLTTVQDELRETNDDLDGKIDELAHVNLRLYEMNKLKDEFLATMSHELRTPLNAVMGFAQVLEADPNAPLDETQAQAVTQIINGGEHLLALINEVLDLAQVERGRISLTLEKVEPRALIDDCLPVIAPPADRRGIRVADRTTDGTVPAVKAAPIRLKQILLNLLSNAVKFNHEGGTVTLDCQTVTTGWLRI